MNNLIFPAILLLFSNAYSLTVGSNTTPSRQASITFPTKTDNQILGFAALDAGFTFADANTSCTYNAFFPTSGIINLKNGKFYLANDFLTNSNCSLVSAGTIWGNMSAILFSPITTATIFPHVATTSPIKIYDLTVYFPNDTTIAAPLYINGSCALIGTGNTVTLNKNKPIIVQRNSELLLQNISLVGLGLNAIACAHETSVIILKDVIASLDYDYNFSKGTLLFQHDVSLRGTNKFIYSARTTSTIDFNTIVFCDHGITLSIYQQRNFKMPLYFADTSSNLYLNGCSLVISKTGLELSQGTVCFDNKVTISCEARNLTGGLTIKSSTNTQVRSKAYVNMYGNIVIE